MRVSASQTVASGSRAELTRLRHAEVHALHSRGVGTTAISTALKVDAKTARRYTRAATADELLTDVPKRGSCLDPYTDYLAQRWAEGCANAVRLTEETRARGYRGSERSVRRLLQTWRASPTPAKPAGSVVTPREVTMWMMRPADKLTGDEHVRLGEVLVRCQTLRTVNQLVSDFAGMARELRGQHLGTRITQARASAITQLAGFAEGLGKDYDAVRNGLTLPWSSGPVEGNVTRLLNRSNDRCTDAPTSTFSAAAPC
jgi:transposase